MPNPPSIGTTSDTNLCKRAHTLPYIHLHVGRGRERCDRYKKAHNVGNNLQCGQRYDK